MKKSLLSLILLFSLASAGARAESPAPQRHPDWKFTDARLIPVQSGGRVKPLDSFARETVLFMTGKRSFKGWDPMDLLFSWITFPEAWEGQQFIQVGRIDVRRQLGLDESRTLFAPGELFKNTTLAQYATNMERGQEGAKPPNPSGTAKGDARDQELKRLLDRLGLFRSIVTGSAWLVIPKPSPAPWESLASGSPQESLIRGHFAEMLRGYQAGDASRFDRSSTLAKASIEGEIQSWSADSARKISFETLYNRVHPFQLSWILYLVGGLLWIVSGMGKGKAKSLAMLSTVSAFVIHIVGFSLRVYISGRAPVTNMYESVVWVMFGVILFAGILYWMQPQAITLAVATIVAAIGLIVADSAPAMLDPSIQPLVPVLRSNFWLTIHVLTITLGYAAFALTLGIGNVTLFHFIRESLGKAAGNSAKILNLNQLTYRAMQFGVVLLAAGTILGGVWADYSWGRFWGWDPKETWALIALLCYLVILHGRYTNWVGQFGYAAWTVVGFTSVLMAWYGVNFVLGAGLHSYGFSTGGVGWVGIFVAAQLGYVAFAALLHSRARKG